MTLYNQVGFIGNTVCSTSNDFLLKKESNSIKEQEVRSRTLAIAALILTLSFSALCSPQTDSATESEIHLDTSAF